MRNQSLKDFVVGRLLPQVQTPAQYVGGELGMVAKDHHEVRGRLCLAFPDAYTIGMSHHGLQVLYTLMNGRDDWACERVFTPMLDMQRLLRRHELPLFSLESFTPLAEFDVLGFTLQYELGYTNVLTMLDLADIPLVAEGRAEHHPLVIAGGPCVANPEPMSRFIDLFVLGDGEQSLPEVCDTWLKLRQSGGDREAMLGEMAARLPYAYVPRFYRPQPDNGRPGPARPTRPGLPGLIQPAVLADLDAMPLPTRPVVPYVECVQDRITLEIMRGCPGRCRFCQSTTLKRPLRCRQVETILQAAMETYRNTGYNEISLLSLSTSDYPHFNELTRRLQQTFRPLGVSVSVPSLRVNEQLRTLSELLNTDRRSGLTLAPEVARDEMREQIGKRITNDDLYEGCRRAFANGFSRVKLYFLCGLPGEREVDLDGIVEMAETISRLGKEVAGRFATVVANVSNFVPKPHTPYQFNAMQRRDYFHAARECLYRQKRLRSVQLKCHDVESSLLEGMLSRGDRRTADAIESAWRCGARFDAWNEHFESRRWWQAFAEAGIDAEQTLHVARPLDALFPWDHMGIHQGRQYLESQQEQSAAHLSQECFHPE
ncbi:MAG: TIGR03960 family B12-binding radical SAM protein [Pirellulales bacterium]|nr:TIGR03960 family B12-binding radical SAM protein [Pirellulales bacterium]